MLLIAGEQNSAPSRVSSRATGRSYILRLIFLRGHRSLGGCFVRDGIFQQRQDELRLPCFDSDGGDTRINLHTRGARRSLAKALPRRKQDIRQTPCRALPKLSVQFFVEFVTADFAVEGRAFDPQQAGGLALVPVGGFERGENVPLFQVVQREGLESAGRRSDFGRVAGGGQV